MELNTVNNSRRTTINPEGSTVLERDPKIQLYLEASNLKIKEDLFYQTGNEKLNNFINLIRNEDDNEYLEGLAKFLCDNGLKLSPVIISVMLSNKSFNFKNKGFEKIFNTPQRIAEAISLGNIYKLNNSFKKNVLKKSLENFSEYTLKKNKLKWKTKKK